MGVVLKSVPVRSLLAGRPPEANVRPTAGSAAKRTVVLDDDPTGSQSVRDMPIITSWEAPEVEWAFDQPGRGFFVLTNSRSLAPIAAARLTTDVVRAVTAAAAARDLAVRFVSRSDSTLRGHFPLETRTITETVDAISGGGDTIVVLAPAFPKAGRLTVDAVHWVVTGDEATPVGLTDYAADATFHYTSSDLGDWVRERTGDSDAAIAWAPLELVRSGVAALADHLLGCAPGSVVVVDAAAESDLDVLAAAVEVLEENGRRVVARGGPSIARALCGQPPPAPLTDGELRDRLPAAGGHGLLVVGSHVSLTTRQLAAVTDAVVIEIDVNAVLDGSLDRDECSARIATILPEHDVMVVTSRALRTGTDAVNSLSIAAVVAAAMVSITRGVLDRTTPAWLLGKGGITSSDLVTRAAGIRRATIAGQLLPGLVSLWEGAGADRRPYPCVIFPGNVGGASTLAEVVGRLRAASA